MESPYAYTYLKKALAIHAFLLSLPAAHSNEQVMLFTFIDLILEHNRAGKMLIGATCHTNRRIYPF